MRAYPENPILVRAWRGNEIESAHRGAWALVDTAGNLVAGEGAWDFPVFARSAIKSIQALPLLESGAAERFALSEEELVLAMASHSGEPCHTERVAALLERMGCSTSALRCGVHAPFDSATRAALSAAGEKPSALHNNCSGKHAGFLALALHAGADPDGYLEPDSPGQVLVREAIASLTDLVPGELPFATDGCSAPTYRLPLDRIARAFARVANPAGLGAQRRASFTRLTDAVARHPELVAGKRKRLCTDIARATGGRLFPKVGAEAVYAIGVRGADLGLAVKIDDGERRALPALVLGLLERFELIEPAELEALASWRAGPLHNHAGLEVGRLEVACEGAPSDD